MHVCYSSKFCFVDNLWFCSLRIIHYSRTLFTGTKSTSIGEQLLPDRGKYGTRHHSWMRPLSFLYCLMCFLLLFSFIHVKANGWIKIRNQCKKMWRVRCDSLHFLCNVWDKIVFVVMYLIIKVFELMDPVVWFHAWMLLLTKYYTKWVDCDLCVTLSFCVPFNPSRQRTLSI
jgi:hypothetical protein